MVVGHQRNPDTTGPGSDRREWGPVRARSRPTAIRPDHDLIEAITRVLRQTGLRQGRPARARLSAVGCRMSRHGCRNPSARPRAWLVAAPFPPGHFHRKGRIARLLLRIVAISSFVRAAALFSTPCAIEVRSQQPGASAPGSLRYYRDRADPGAQSSSQWFTWSCLSLLLNCGTLKLRDIYTAGHLHCGYTRRRCDKYAQTALLAQTGFWRQ